jgi:transposase-like protein
MNKHYETSFKEMIVDLYNRKKSASSLCKEYGLSRSLIYSWIYASRKKEESNVTPQQLIEENQLLKKQLESALFEKEILMKKKRILSNNTKRGASNK